MAPGSRARKGASVALYYLAQSPGSAQGLAGAMMELGCTRTHDARPCVSWGGSTTAPAAAGCAASVGEAVGWCWVDEGHTEWAYCEPNCRWEAESPGHFNLRDPEKFPVLDEAARHLHAAEPDVESARKVLSKAVDASHSVIEQHWLNGGKSKESQNIRRQVIQAAHASFQLAALAEGSEPTASEANFRVSCPLLQDLYGNPDRGMPTAFTASCFENWMRTLQEQGDERSLTDVRLLAQDKKYRAEFKLRHENWRYAMEAIESFGSSRTADRREGAAYKLAKKQLPKAAVGWSDELRQYALELMSRAGVRDAVSVAADEVRKLESSYGKLTEGQQCDGGAPDERASAIGDRLVVARTLHRSLPPAPQAMEQGTAATQSVAYVTCLVASIMFAILFVLRWSCQRHVRILQRKHGGARTYGCRGTFEQLGRVGVQWWESAAQYAGQWRQEQPAVVVTAPAQRQAQRKRKPPKGPAKAARKQPEAVPKASADKQATQGSESPPHKAKKKVGKKAPNQKVEKKPEAKKQEKKTKEKKTKEKQSAAKKNKNKKKAAAAAASEQRVVEVVEAPGSEKSGKQKPEKKNAPPEPSSVAASPTRPKIVVRPTEPGPVTVFRKRQSSQPVSDVSEPDLEDDEQTQRGHESPRKSGKVQGLPDKAAGGKLSWAQKLQAGGRSKADAVSPPSPAKQGAVQAQGETAEDAPTAAPTLAPAPQGKARRRQRTLSQTAEDEGSDDGGGVFPTKRQPKEDSKASNPWQEKKLERERAQARASKHGAWAGRPEEAAGAIGNSSVPEREPNKAKQSKAAPNADLKATQAKTEAAEKAKQLVAPLPSFLKPETEKAPREEQRPEAAQSASASASAVALSLQSLDRDASPLSTPTSAPSSPASSRSSAKADHQPDASSANAERQVRQSTGTRNAHESEAARRPRTGQDGQREMPVGVPMPMMPMPMQMGMPMQGQMAMPMHPGAHQHGQMPAQAMWQGQPMHPQAAAQMHHFNAMQQQLFEQRLRCRQALEQQILFYFSADNIRGDKFLRTHMDADGFVKLSLIAGFRRIKALTSDMSLVAEAVLAHPDKMQLRMVDAPNASNSFPRLQEPLIRSVDPAVLAFVQNDRR